MDDDGQGGGSRQFHLADEDVLLDLARRVVVIVVETDFSPGYDFCSAAELFKLTKIGVGGKFGFVRMNADRGVDEVVLLGNFDAAIERAGALAGSNRQQVDDAGLMRTSDNPLAIFSEPRTVEMAVRVDEHAEQSATAHEQA